MNILGIDPGETTGWCLYGERCVYGSGQFPTHEVPREILNLAAKFAATVVIEGFAQVHAGIYPQTVAAAWTGGRIVERIENATSWTVAEITRHDVKMTLHTAIHGEFPIKKDRDVWAALKLLHGGEASAKRGGCLYGVKAHERAALAVAVAYALRQAAATGVTP